MGNRALPDGMTWEDCRICGGLTIVSESSSVYGGTISCCYECMKKARSDAERQRDALETARVALNGAVFARDERIVELECQLRAMSRAADEFGI